MTPNVLVILFMVSKSFMLVEKKNIENKSQSENRPE